jgi:RND family efflux transporter MFP subunit
MEGSMTPNETNVTTEKPATEPKLIQAPAGQGDRRGRRRVVVGTAVFVVCVIAVVIIYGIRSRLSAETALQLTTDRDSVLSVIVTHPQPAPHTQEIVYPGNTQAFIDSPIYARTNGYLKRWYFDIGARVRQGQLLAEIETPELDQQLQQARADLSTSEANYRLSQITAARDENLLTTHSISTQERDNATHGNAANEAIVRSNQANVARLEQLQSYEKVYAPFDGVITARSTDIGALIDAGANAPKELFHIASINKLRVYVSLPEVYSPAARAGTSADLTLDEFPGQTFHGVLVRNSNAIDYTSRTLLVEVDVDNPKGLLMPGSYVQVHFKLPADVSSVVIPSNALLFRKEGLQVGVVRNGKAQLVKVTPGHDYGATMEILAGLQATDDLILSPADSLVSGTPVQISQPSAGGLKQ